MKADVRQSMLKARRQLDPGTVREKSGTILARLRALPAYREARAVLFYFPINNEVDTVPLIREALEEKRVLLPYMEDGIKAARVTDLDDLTEGMYGTKEPVTKEPAAFDLVLVPGLAFDRARNRIGYGKGWYDRFLASCNAGTIGLAFGMQIVDSLPVEPHDIPMDIVVTEEGII